MPDRKGSSVHILRETGFVGVDGAGSINSRTPKLRAVGLEQGWRWLDEEENVCEKAELATLAPGMQAVPRPEAYSVL